MLQLRQHTFLFGKRALKRTKERILVKAPPNQDSLVNSNVSELSIIRGHEMLTFLPHFCLPIRQVNTEVPELLLLKVSLQLPKHHQHVFKNNDLRRRVPPLFFVVGGRVSTALHHNHNLRPFHTRTLRRRSTFHRCAKQDGWPSGYGFADSRCQKKGRGKVQCCNTPGHPNGCFRKYPQIINFYRVFHYKSSILGYPYFWKHPNDPCFDWKFDLDGQIYTSIKANPIRKKALIFHRNPPNFPYYTYDTSKSIFLVDNRQSQGFARGIWFPEGFLGDTSLEMLGDCWVGDHCWSGCNKNK